MILQLKDTGLYQLLEKKCATDEAGPLKGTELVTAVDLATRDMGTVLNRASTNFPDYTLHDEEHAVRVVRLMDRFLGKELSERLNVVEIALLILSAYGHDTGMAIGRDRKESIIKSEQYASHVASNEKKWQEAQDAAERGDSNHANRLTDDLFVDFLRQRHHIISAELMGLDFKDRLVVSGKSLVSACAKLCRSHGESIDYVAELGTLPFAGEFSVDLTFLACVLRLSDYAELDPSRAPQWLLERVVRPRSDISWREWRKHQASSFSISTDSISFHGEFTDYFDHKALADTLVGMEAERHDVMDLLLRRSNELKRLNLNKPIDVRIEARGYIFEQFKFQLEYREIIQLLMGTRLYGDERVFLRELLQNSLDACRHAQAASEQRSRKYEGRITVRRYLMPENNQEVIEISDNGSGMTRTVIRDYFMRVGKSYYQSYEFRSKKLPFQPVSQFGVGVLSCFMKADYLEVETKPDPLVHGDCHEADRLALKLEIRGPHEFFVVRKSPRDEYGTTVRVFLKKPLVESLKSITSRFVARIPYRVEIQDGASQVERLESRQFAFDEPQFANAFVGDPASFGYVSKDLRFEGRLGFEPCGVFRFFLLKSVNRSHLKVKDAGKYSLVSFSANGETLLVASHLTDEVRKRISNRLIRVRTKLPGFPTEVQREIERLAHDMERICDLLGFQHETNEVAARWGAIRSQLNVLKQTRGFSTQMAGVMVDDEFSKASDELMAFVEGRYQLHSPQGILTQDGLNLTGSFGLPQRLRLGIGYLFNLDLSGSQRLTLNVARDDVIIDSKTEELVGFLHLKIGEFLGAWFREEQVDDTEVQDYLAQREISPAFREAVRAAYRLKDGSHRIGKPKR